MGRVSKNDREQIKRDILSKHNADGLRVKQKKERKKEKKKSNVQASTSTLKSAESKVAACCVWDDTVSPEIVEELKQEAIEMFLDQQEGYAGPAVDTKTKRVDFTDDDGDVCSLRLKTAKNDGRAIIKVYVNDDVNQTYPVVENEVIAESKTGTLHLGPDSCVLPPSERHKLAAIEQLCANAGVPYVDEDNQPGFSYFIKPGEAPATAVEAFALAVYEECTRSMPERVRCHPSSGAEFWVQVRGAGGETTEEQAITWHVDKDEEKWDAEQECVAPHLATVTYLTDGGTPTVVVESSGGSDAVLGLGSTTGVGCKPKRGRQLRFQGNLLHAVPAELAEPGYEEMRVTLLVNIWLEHQPSELKRYEKRDDTGGEAPPPAEAAAPTIPRLDMARPVAFVHIPQQQGEMPRCKPFSFAGHGYKLRLPLKEAAAGLHSGSGAGALRFAAELCATAPGT